MSLNFGEVKGDAVFKSDETYEYRDGENVVSLIDGILPAMFIF
jgi:hypothetical protein